MSLNDALNKWAKSGAGKKKIKEMQDQAMKGGKPLGGSKYKPDYYAKEFISILRGYIEEAGFEFADYLDWLGVGWNSSVERYELHVNFDPSRISRPSLNPTKYPDGAYDIVTLLNNGYDAAGRTYGWWPSKGIRIPSLPSREGAGFMQKAVDEFNRKFGPYVKAELNSKYESK